MRSAVDEFISDMMAVCTREIRAGQPVRIEAIEPSLLRIGPPTHGPDIEAQAKRRLADEYDAAQDRGEVAKLGTNKSEPGIPKQNTRPVTVAEIGLTSKDIHEARIIRDAEMIDPGVVRSPEREELSPRVASFRAHRRRVAEELEADAATILLKMREALR